MKRVVLVAIALLFLSFAMPSSNAEARKFWQLLRLFCLLPARRERRRLRQVRRSRYR